MSKQNITLLRPRFYLPFGYGKILIHSFVEIVVEYIDIF